MRRPFSICLMILFCLGCREATALKGDEIQPLVNEEYFRVLQEQINKARQEIIISSFLFNSRFIVLLILVSCVELFSIVLIRKMALKKQDTQK